jgi:hypothetical protein
MQWGDGFSRRELLAGLGLLSLAPGVRLAEASAQVSGVSESLDDQTFDEFIRMRTAPDLAPVLWVYSGVLVVKPAGEVARPIARVEGLSRTQAKSSADGSWLWELDEAGYYCDLRDGRPARALTNPFTGKTVEPRHYRSPQSLIFSKRGITPTRGAPPGVEFRGEITRLAKVAGTTALTEDLYVKLPGRGASGDTPARPTRFAASLATFTTRTAQLTRPRNEWVDCQFNYTTLNSFVDWLGMQGQEGVQDMRIVGIKCRIDETTMVPPWLLERLKIDHPDLLSK